MELGLKVCKGFSIGVGCWREILSCSAGRKFVACAVDVKFEIVRHTITEIIIEILLLLRKILFLMFGE